MLGEFGVTFHLQPLFVTELAGFIQHAVTHAELTDVVQQRGSLQKSARLEIDAHFLCDQIGEQRDAVAMSRRIGAFGVDDLSEASGDIIKIVVICHDRLLPWLGREHNGFQIGGR
ncbi:hypothetical protein D3C73_509240 [compost metagenome]